MTICETERLILREITSEDAEYDYLLNQDPEVLKYTGETAFESIEAAKYFLEHEDQYKKYGFGRWAVIDKTENNFLGWCGLKYTSNPEELDLGFRFNKKYWNIDFAAESVKACVNLGFNRFGMETIVGRAVKENTDFIHLFEKIGLKYYRDSKYIGQAGVIYKIEKTEIPSVETAITKSEKSDSLAQVELPETASDRLQTVLNMYTPGLFILSEAEYNYSPSANKWSKKEILGHLIDSAANNHQRIIRSQYEAVPTVVYDANQWNRLNHYKTMQGKQLLSFWTQYNQLLIAVIKQISAENLQKECNTGSKKNVTIEWLIEDYITHLEHHLKQIVDYKNEVW